MAVITKIEAQKRKEDRVNIYVDEKFFMAIYKELVFTFNLKKGDNIDEEYLKKILKDEMFLKGKNKALNILSKAIFTHKVSPFTNIVVYSVFKISELFAVSIPS